MEVTGAAGTTGVSAAKHVTRVGSGASGCVRAPGYRDTPATAQERRFGPVTKRSALVSDSIEVCKCGCVRESRAKEGEPQNICLCIYYSCFTCLYKQFFNSLWLFFLQHGCLFYACLSACVWVSDREIIRICVCVSVCVPNLHMHSMCQAE